jgi:hypothetical protein
VVQYTTKLNLYKPGGGALGTNTPDEVADIDKLNGNFDVLDAAFGVTICTSSTRPSSPYVGRTIYQTDDSKVFVWTGSAWAAVAESVTPINVVTFTNKTLTSPRETTTVSATAATGSINFDAVTQADLYYTTDASANFTLNFRGNGSTTLSSMLTTGQSITLVFRNTNGATAYYPTAFSIDGTAVTPKWQGGVAPVVGNSSAVDVYTFVITKTGASTYVVLASQTKFA